MKPDDLYGEALRLYDRILKKLAVPLSKIKALYSRLYRKAEPLIKKAAHCLYLVRRKLREWHAMYRRFRVLYLHAGELREHVLVRYIIHELLIYFAVAFLFFFMIFFVNQILLVAENILKKHVPFWDVMKLLTYSLPFLIAQSAPFATLVGFVMCLGRMMTDNEILIVRASGQSYKIVLVPVMILGLAISLVSFFVNDYLLPVGTIKYNKMQRQIATSNPGVVVEPHSVKRLNNATIVIGDVDGSNVSDLVFIDKGDDGRMRIITAGKSEVLSAKREGVLMQLNMSGATAAFLDSRKAENYDVLDADKVTMNIFDSAFFDNNYAVSPREMTSYDLGRTISGMKKTGGASKQTLDRYIMEYQKKFSLPLGSIFFALLALSLAFLFGKHNGQTIGLILGLIISVLYWATMMLCMIFTVRIHILNSTLSMWIPDIAAGAAGLLFYALLKKQ